MAKDNIADGLFSTAGAAGLSSKGKWPTSSEVADMVKEGSVADMQRTPFQFTDPAYFDPILFFIQHRDRKELNFRLRYEYEFHPLIHNVIDLHCFPAGQPVITSEGVKAIENITIDDKVMSTSGEYQSVLGTDVHPFKGDMYSFKVLGLPEFECTDEHPILVRESKRVKLPRIDKHGKPKFDTEQSIPIGEPIWKKAKDIKVGDYALVPRIYVEGTKQVIDLSPFVYKSSSLRGCRYQVDKDQVSIKIGGSFTKTLDREYVVDEELATLLGWYVAEGSGGQDLTLHSEEVKEASQLVSILQTRFKAHVKINKRKNSNCQNLTFICTPLNRMLISLCGNGAKNKRIPKVIMDSDLSVIKAFLKAYIEGDGHIHKGRKTISWVTVSKTLAYQTMELCNRLGVYSKLMVKEKNVHLPEYIVSINRRDLYEDLWGVKEVYKNKSNSTVHKDDKYFYSPIRNISKSVVETDVYDIHTEDNTFCTPLVVHNSQFPLSDFMFQASETKHQQFYNDFKDDIELLPLMMDILKDYYLLGESICHGHWDENGKTWKNFVMYPPEFIDIKGTHIIPEKMYFLEVDNKLKTLVNSSNAYDQSLVKNIDPNVVDQIRNSGKIWLQPEQTFGLFSKTARYDLRGTSIVKSVYKDLMYEHKLRLLQFAYIDRHAFPIKIFKLGDPAKGWIPPKAHFDAFRSLLASSANDPDMNLIYHYGVSVDYVGTKDKIMNLIPEFEFVENRILTGLYTNKSITHSEGVTYANANVSVRVLMHRYLTIRDQLELILRNKIFKRIAIEREYYKKDANDPTAERINGKYYALDIPKIKWRKLNLLDDTSQKQFLQKMREMKDVSHKVMCEAMDLESGEIIKQLKDEEGTVVDPEYQSAREKLAGDKQIAPQILKGIKGDQYTFDKIMENDKDATPTETGARRSSKPSTSIRPAPKPSTTEKSTEKPAGEPVVAPAEPPPLPGGEI